MHKASVPQLWNEMLLCSIGEQLDRLVELKFFKQSGRTFLENDGHLIPQLVQEEQSMEMVWNCMGQTYIAMLYVSTWCLPI